MEAGDWARATERAKAHPREVKNWASIRSKSSAGERKVSSAKRLALHHACFKLRSSAALPASTGSAYNYTDPFVEVSRFILLLLEIYPEAASLRESRHGCLPLHLAAFASCTVPSREPNKFPLSPSSVALSSPSSSIGSPRVTFSGNLSRPSAISNEQRSASESTVDTIRTTMSAAIAEEFISGAQTEYQMENGKKARRSDSIGTVDSAEAVARASNTQANSLSVSIGRNILISEKREEWAVRVLNALLDAFPRGIRMDSEGGRLPLHTACAGRATPRVVSTLITAYPAAARHRNKDGFLPLHLAAHWGISHANVATALLKAYPDATFGRNRWERTPLEEALCMAGENGRPHQAALVRALRKHPSYWTRPADLFNSTSPRERYQIVDIDASLPSNEDESLEGEDHRLIGGSPDDQAEQGLYRLFRNSRDDGEGVEVLHPSVDLPTLIKGQNWEMVLMRLETNPLDAEEELKIVTRGGFTSTSGFTPLHYACERRPPAEVVEALVAACPGAVTKRSMPGGALPLHIACTWDAPVSSITTLLAADRTTCKIPDELGNLPIHSASFSGTGAHVFESLLHAYPKASLARNNQGSLPEEIIKRLRHNNRGSVLALLDICKEEVIAKRQDRHRRHRSDELFNATRRTGALNGRHEEATARDSENQDLEWV